MGPPSMCGDGGGLGIGRSADHRRMSDQATEDMPLILLEVAAGESEAHLSTLQDDRTELGRLDARLLEQFSPGGLFRRLTGVDSSARQVPPRGARRLRRV